MDDFSNEQPDEAARRILVWKMSQIRADLAFALGWKRQQVRAWEKRCSEQGVHLKLAQADHLFTHIH